MKRLDRGKVESSETIVAPNGRRRDEAIPAVRPLQQQQRDTDIEMSVVFAEDHLPVIDREDREEVDAITSGFPHRHGCAQPERTNDEVADRQQGLEQWRGMPENRLPDRVDVAAVASWQLHRNASTRSAPGYQSASRLCSGGDCSLTGLRSPFSTATPANRTLQTASAPAAGPGRARPSPARRLRAAAPPSCSRPPCRGTSCRGPGRPPATRDG